MALRLAAGTCVTGNDRLIGALLSMGSCHPGVTAGKQVISFSRW